MRKKRVRRVHPLRRILSTLFVLAILGAIGFCVYTFAIDTVTVKGKYMQNAMEDGDLIVVNRIAYRLGEPSRFDVIEFPFQYKEQTTYLGRVIGLPGESVQIDSGKIYINGIQLNEKYGTEPIDEAGLAANKIILGEGEYFVMSDNRNNSFDSREPMLGTIKKENIIGKAVLCIWPLRSVRIL